MKTYIFWVLDFGHLEMYTERGVEVLAHSGKFWRFTTPRLTSSVGCKVVRGDIRARRVVDFAVNKIAGPASKLQHEGFERPSHCQFGPDGALYVVDWGEIEICPGARRSASAAGSR